MSKVSDSPQLADDLVTTPVGASEKDPVLASIEKRELELKAKILRAHQSAEEILSKARSEAAGIRARIDRSGREEGAEVSDGDLQSAHEKAAAIGVEAERTRAELMDRGRQNSAKAVAMLMCAVLPETETTTESEVDHVS